MKIDPMKVLPLEQLQLNEGQLPWLRRNPRTWTRTDIDRTTRSIDEDAELMQARPLLAVPGPDKNTYVVFGGNLRLTACRALEWPGAPVVVFHPDNEKHPSEIDKKTIHRIALKDNGSFGSWDPHELANWDFEPLELVDFGLPDFVGAGRNEAQGPDQYGTDFSLPDGGKSPFRQVSFQMPDELAASLLLAVKAAQYTPEFAAVCENIDDKNSNGYAVYVIAKAWADELLKGLTSADLKESEKGIAELRQYLRDALKKSGKKAKDVDDLLGTNGMSGHYFGESQWMFPTRSAYEKMREILPLDRDYCECKKIEMRHNLLTSLQEYKKNGQS